MIYHFAALQPLGDLHINPLISFVAETVNQGYACCFDGSFATLETFFDKLMLKYPIDYCLHPVSEKDALHNHDYEFLLRKLR